MKIKSIILCLALLCALAACNSDKAEDVLSLEDLIQANTLETVLSQHSSAQVVVTLHNLEQPDATWNVEERTVVKRGDQSVLKPRGGGGVQPAV